MLSQFLLIYWLIFWLVHSHNHGFSSLTDSSYEPSSISSPFHATSGFNYGAASTLGGGAGIPFKGASFSPSYTFGESAINEGLPSMSYGSSVQLNSNGPPQGLSYSGNEGGAGSVQISHPESYAASSQFDMPSYYPQVMRPSLGPIMPMGQVSYGPGGPQGPESQGPSPYLVNNIYGKPANHNQKQSQYAPDFPRFRPASALSLYKVRAINDAYFMAFWRLISMYKEI